MNKKGIIAIIIVILAVLLTFSAVSGFGEKDDSIYQVSLLQSFMHGEYDGVVSVEELKSHGDIGLGTFNGINGEMIYLDGKVYRALTNGSIEEVSSDDSIPFATVTYYDEDESMSDVSAKDFDDLTGQLTKEIKKYGANHIYVLKIDGTFDNITYRSVKEQEKPYKEFTEVAAKDQVVFNATNQKGTLVAIYFPKYMGELNMPGWHLHFLSDDKSKGGHVLNVSVSNAHVGIDEIEEFNMIVPDSESFNNRDLTENMSEKINSVE